VSEPARQNVLAYVAALNAADINRIAACVTEDFWNEHVTVSGQSLRGRAAYRERLAGFLAVYRDMTYTVERLLIDGDDVALSYTMRFQWHGAEPPRHVTTRGVFLFHIRHGLIAHRIDYRDSADAKQQMDAA
jgi:ketosteroid isomerase-like protein